MLANVKLLIPHCSQPWVMHALGASMHLDNEDETISDACRHFTFAGHTGYCICSFHTRLFFQSISNPPMPPSRVIDSLKAQTITKILRKVMILHFKPKWEIQALNCILKEMHQCRLHILKICYCTLCHGICLSMHVL